ncbi:MAG: hypothetical protein QNK11_07870 [Legionella sp.]|nr:hypothetical protein [Legionella sp.]
MEKIYPKKDVSLLKNPVQNKPTYQAPAVFLLKDVNIETGSTTVPEATSGQIELALS